MISETKSKILESPTLFSYLKQRNYWWETRKIRPEDGGILREEYLERVADLFKLKRIVCLAGIRRSGKSTLLFQLMGRLIDSGEEPKHIVYVKMDDIHDQISHLREVIEHYHELTGVDPNEQKVYFLLDEIQYLENWQQQLKYFIDDPAFKGKFIVSGSSKTLLYKGAAESLVGRISFVDVFPLTFREFVEFEGIKISAPKRLEFKEIKKFYLSVADKVTKLKTVFRRYLEVGGFPEWFAIKDMLRWQRVLVDDYFSLILSRDVANVFKVKDPFLLEKLAKEVAIFSTNRFNYSNLAERLNTDRNTVKLYLYYLYSSLLIFIADVYSKSKKAVERKEKKIYFWEEGLRKAITLDTDEAKAVENVVAWHLVKKGFAEKVFFEPFYWKNGKEVDFIYDGRSLLPVEVKYRENPHDVKGLLEFAERFGCERALVVTKDLFEEKEYELSKSSLNVTFIPAWMFLMIVA